MDSRDLLIALYTYLTLEKARSAVSAHRQTLMARLGPKDKQFLSHMASSLNSLHRYKAASARNKALETIDLGRIYAGVDRREREKQNPKLNYQDFLVLELLDYFKNDFFKWVTNPECPTCHKDGSNIVSAGARKPPSQNPDMVSIIEVYRCTSCGTHIVFPRINNPVRLLETRRGRCGEWVNCFLLLLHAVLGEDAQIRYVWNYEDHVWCEYYSEGLQKWVHLDPCENVFDEPSLYCSNWGKKMSWVIGFNDTYVIDLSDKYITNEEKRIPKLTVVNNVSLVSQVLKMTAIDKMNGWFITNVVPMDLPHKESFLQLYYKVLLLYNQESKRPAEVAGLKLTIKGRQTGGQEWTTLRGENGSS